MDLKRRLRAIFFVFFLAAGSASAEENELTALINEYRGTPQTCEGKRHAAAGPLAPNAALSGVRIDPGVALEDALKEAEYQAAHVQTITVSGPPHARGVMAFIKKRYCNSLLDTRYAEIGVAREGADWRIVLAQPLLSPDLGDWQEAGMRVLELVNDARSKLRLCGRKKFSAAPSLNWNAKLAAAALAHSSDMARRNYFGHVTPDGAEVGDRVSRESYSWRRVGENVAAGQGSARGVVSGWLASPTHCANIMNPNFLEMGAAHAINAESKATIYWTQVFGTPRK